MSRSWFYLTLRRDGPIEPTSEFVDKFTVDIEESNTLLTTFDSNDIFSPSYLYITNNFVTDIDDTSLLLKDIYEFDTLPTFIWLIDNFKINIDDQDPLLAYLHEEEFEDVSSVLAYICKADAVASTYICTTDETASNIDTDASFSASIISENKAIIDISTTTEVIWYVG